MAGQNYSSDRNGNHKYYARVHLGGSGRNAKYRYFYSRFEYEAYMRNKSKSEAAAKTRKELGEKNAKAKIMTSEQLYRQKQQAAYNKNKTSSQFYKQKMADAARNKELVDKQRAAEKALYEKRNSERKVTTADRYRGQQSKNGYLNDRGSKPIKTSEQLRREKQALADKNANAKIMSSEQRYRQQQDLAYKNANSKIAPSSDKYRALNNAKQKIATTTDKYEYNKKVNGLYQDEKAARQRQNVRDVNESIATRKAISAFDRTTKNMTDGMTKSSTTATGVGSSDRKISRSEISSLVRRQNELRSMMAKNELNKAQAIMDKSFADAREARRAVNLTGVGIEYLRLRFKGFN